jgi:hypothetical protein
MRLVRRQETVTSLVTYLVKVVKSWLHVCTFTKESLRFINGVKIRQNREKSRMTLLICQLVEEGVIIH